MTIVALLSGGIGSRIQSDIPKQYIRAGGKMMVTWALEPLIRSSYVDCIYIAAEREWRERIIADLKGAELDMSKIRSFVMPGANRQTSIMNALQAIMRDYTEVDAADTVLIHDAARPFLTEDILNKCYEALPGHDGVMPVLPMKDTVYLSNDGHSVDRLLDRSSIFAGQAPELFRLVPYYRANMSLMPDKILNINGSTEPAIIAGMDIAMVPGDEKNFKVTTDSDLERFKQIIAVTHEKCERSTSQRAVCNKSAFP